MTLSVWLDNLLAYSLQIALLVAAGTLFAYLSRLRAPRVALAYWQILLLSCLLLPVLQTWQRPTLATPLSVPGTPIPVPGTVAAPAVKAPIQLTYHGIALILAAGVALRLIWLILGLLRLHLFCRKARWISKLPPAVREVQARLGIRAEVFFSQEIDSPVTFGIRRPTILLPITFDAMSESRQKAVACHELLHVRRCDWGFILLEGAVRSLFWFHPAVWWVAGRIHLHREQVVDHEVVRLTGDKQPYLDSLLEIAQARGRPRAVPAPLFLREHHLVERVALLLKEVSMSRSRLIASLVGAAALLVCTGYLAAGWFPLAGPPEITSDSTPVSPPQAPRREAIRVGGNVQESKLLDKVEPVYPEMAKAARVSGRVILQVTVNEEGQVWDVKVLRGHPLLNEAAVSAVRQWRYAPTYLNGEPVPVLATVTVVFNVRDKNDLVIGMDESGNLREYGTGLEGEALAAKIREGKGSVIVSIAPSTPLPVAEAAIGKVLRKYRPLEIQVTGPFRLHEGRLYYVPGPGTGITAPQLALEEDRLSALAAASGLAEETPRAGNVPRVLIYSLLIDEVGEIVAVQRMGGPEIPAVETELAHTPVLAPGRRGPDPVPAVVFVEVKVR
jgi:TonB family protein